MDKIERRVGLLTGVAIIFFVMYLVGRNEEFQSQSLYELIRIVVSLGLGIVAATVPGFMGVQGSVGGFTIRAGGGLAAFMLTYFFSPGSIPALTPPPQGVVQVDPIKAVDFRTLAPPGATPEERSKAGLAVTVPLLVRSIVQPSRNNTVEKTVITISLGESTYSLSWRDFVQMHEENVGKWLGKEQSAVPFSIPTGEIIYKEILHVNPTGSSWEDFLNNVRADKRKSIDVLIEIETNVGKIYTKCTADMRERNIELDDFIQKAGRSPGRITTTCV